VAASLNKSVARLAMTGGPARLVAARKPRVSVANRDLDDRQRRGSRKTSAARLYLDALAESGRRTQRQALGVVIGILRPGARLDRMAWHRLRFEDLARLRAALSARYAPATANRILCAARGVLKASWRLGLMTAEDYLRAVDVEKVRGSALPRGRALEPQELERLYQVCAADPTPAGARDGAAIALMHGAGLRRAEVVLLDVDAVDLRTGAVTVHGKGRRMRLVYLGSGLPWLEAWLAIRGDASGPLLFEVRFGEFVEHRLSPAAMYKIVKDRARQAGIEQCSPHDLRRTFATELLDAGADIALVQQLLGHSSVQTTTIYDRRGEAAKVAAQRRLNVPQPGRSRA